MQHPVRLLLLTDLACRSASRESGVSSPLIRGAFGVVDRYRLGPRESQPRRWIGGGRMHLLGEITHQTRATGEVAAPPLGVIEGFENVG
jgi:hypothetical protein